MGINDKPAYVIRAVHRNGYQSNIGYAYRQEKRRIKLVIEFVPVNWTGELVLVPLSKQEAELL